MQNIEWKDGMESRSRWPFLLFVKGDKVIPFRKKDIVGVAVIRGTDRHRNGKWSYTSYRLVVPDNIRVIAGLEGWNTGTFAEGLGRSVGVPTPDLWPEMAEALGVSVPSAMEFLRAWRPKAAERLDRTEAALSELEDSVTAESDEDAVKVTVSFGSPTNSRMRAGFWTEPKSLPGYPGAEIRLINPDKGWAEGNVEVSGVNGTVLSVKRSAGYHGGYCAVEVAVVPSSLSPEGEDEAADPVAESEAGADTADTAMAEALKKAGLC